jgi:hypothetical protein
MQVQPDEDLTETFKALSHSLRQDIILILAESYHEGIGFTALQKELNQNIAGKKIQVGTIYHHVKLLGDLIDQTKSSKWTLTDKGWFAYNLLTSSQDRTYFIQIGEKETQSQLSFISRVLAPPEIFLYVKKAPFLYFGWQIIFFLLFGLIVTESNLVLVFVFFGVLPEKNFLLSLGSIWISWIAFSLLTIISSKQILRRKKFTTEDIGTIMIFLGISMGPLLLFPLFISFSVINLSQQIIPLTVVIILQLWVIILVTRGISVQFFIRMERAAIIGLTTVYLMMILGIIFGF